MDLRLIKTKRDYQAALKRAEQLWHAAAGSTEADALDVLILLIADYEQGISDCRSRPDPVPRIRHGITRADAQNLVPYLGSRARVAEVLNRNRALTLEMIRRLSETRAASRRAGTAIRAAPCRIGYSASDSLGVGHSATIDPVLCSVCPVLCLVVAVFDAFALTGFLLIQALTERHNPSFSIVIPVVVGSNPISHPNTSVFPRVRLLTL